jgi:hypothetical protein
MIQQLSLENINLRNVTNETSFTRQVNEANGFSVSITYPQSYALTYGIVIGAFLMVQTSESHLR